MVVDSKKLGVQNKRQHALKLQKGSYGLKESGRLWNLMFHYIFDVFGFQSMLHGQFPYIKTDTDGKTLVGIYVEDVLAMGTSVKKVDYFLPTYKFLS